MSLLRQHFAGAFNIGFKIKTNTPTTNAHGQEVDAYTTGSTTYDAYLSTVRSQTANRKVSGNDNLVVDEATHKLYTDLAQGTIKKTDRLLVIGGQLDDQTMEILYIHPQPDGKGGIDHLVVYLKYADKNYG